MLFSTPVFNLSHNNDYVEGVQALQNGDYTQAEKSFRLAAKEKHPNALFNLALMNLHGLLDYYDPNEILENLKLAKEVGHERAGLHLQTFEEFATAPLDDNELLHLVENFFESSPYSRIAFSGSFTLIACILMERQLYSMTNPKGLLQYEIESAYSADNDFVTVFLNRFNIPRAFYINKSAVAYVEEDVDRVTDFFNHLSFIQRKCMSSDQTTRDNQIMYTRCIVLGHLINVALGKELTLPGYHTFFKASRNWETTEIK